MSDTPPDPYQDDQDLTAPERHYATRRDEVARRRAVVKKMAKRYENRATIPHSDRPQEPGRQEDPANGIPRQDDPVAYFASDDDEPLEPVGKHARTRPPASNQKQIKKSALKSKAIPRVNPPLVGAAVFALIAVVLIGTSVARARAYDRLVQTAGSDATAAVQGFATFAGQVEGDDLDGAEKTAGEIDGHIAALEQTVASDDWQKGSGDVASAGAGTAKRLRAAYDALVTPVLAAGKGQGSFDVIGDDNAVDTDLVLALDDALAAADPTVDDLEDTLASLEESGAFADAAKQAKSSLAEIKSATSLAATLQPCLSGLLGADGSRTFLVVVQDNAQWRSTGGYPRSLAALTVADGSLSLSTLEVTRTAYPFLYYGKRVEATQEELALFGSEFNKHMDTILTVPDVPRAAQIMTQTYQKTTGTEVSGVIFVDPVAFAGMLDLAGETTLESGDVVDASNVASYMENELPRACGSWEFDALFTSAATGVLDTFMDDLGSYDLKQLADFACSQAASGHLIMWSPDEAEEVLFAHFGADGALGLDSSEPELGVFLNDATGGGIDWYLTATTDVGDPKTADNGSQTYTVTTTIANSLTAEQAQEIRSANYGTGVLGTSYGKYDQTDAVVDLYLFAPAGGAIEDLDVTTTADQLAWQQQDELPWEGLTATTGTLHVGGGETVTLTYRVTCAADAATLRVRQTPNSPRVGQ